MEDRPLILYIAMSLDGYMARSAGDIGWLSLVISLIPIQLGEGIPQISSGRPEQPLYLTRSLTFSTGLVQLWYERKK